MNNIKKRTWRLDSECTRLRIANWIYYTWKVFYAMRWTFLYCAYYSSQPQASVRRLE